MEVVYVSPTGTSTALGTVNYPLDIETGMDVVTDTGTVYVMDGIYRITVIAPFPFIVRGGNVQAVVGARPILTSADDTPLSIDCKCNTNGLWMGGTRESSPDSAIFVLDDKEFKNNTIFGYYQAIAEGQHNNILYQFNRFVNCGGDGLYHPIYISSDSHARIYDNLFVGGEGYAIHLWHQADHVDVQGNFTGGNQWSLVMQTVNDNCQHNVFWNHTPIVGAWLTVNIGAGTFTHNLFGHKTFGTGKWDQDINNGILTVDGLGLIGDRYIDSTTWSGYSIAVGSYNGEGHVLPAPGTNYTHYSLTDLPTLLGYSEEQIDTAVAALIASFDVDLQTIHDDETLEPNFTILRDCVNAWKVA